jgi:hypothetical protein
MVLPALVPLLAVTYGPALSQGPTASNGLPPLALALSPPMLNLRMCALELLTGHFRGGTGTPGQVAPRAWHLSVNGKVFRL